MFNLQLGKIIFWVATLRISELTNSTPSQAVVQKRNLFHSMDFQFCFCSLNMFAVFGFFLKNAE